MSAAREAFMGRLMDEVTPVEYFKEHVGKAIEHQNVVISTPTEHYVVQLLTRCVRADGLPAAESDEMPLALLYMKALQSAKHERARLLREMGDTALFVSGFFADRLIDRVGDLRYYRRLGGDAYARLSRESNHDAWAAEVFRELAARFRELADILCEVSEASRMSGARSVLRLYERWLQTRSVRAARLLAEEGITPMEPGEGRVH